MAGEGGDDNSVLDQGQLRRRKKNREDEVSEDDSRPQREEGGEKQDERSSPSILRHSYWLTRVVFLRSLALIYLVAFLVALDQNADLIGDRGLLPLKLHLSRLREAEAVGGEEGEEAAPSTFLRRFCSTPTLLWLLEPWDEVDWALRAIAASGAAISALVLLTGAANAPALMALWVLYHSLVNVGQRWYSFGWESQLLETGFLAIWIVPVLKWSPLPADTPTPWIAVAGYRWLIMRIMIGAGLIKIRGDACWRDFTCMHYFFETQPNPNPMSFWAHWAPDWWHRFEIFGNHVVELLLPFLTLVPFRWAAMTNGALQLLFQAVLIATGNLSFLNWLTMLPSLWYFDDDFWSKCFSARTVLRAKALEVARRADSEAGEKKKKDFGTLFRKAFNFAVAGLIAMLSYPIVMNLVSSRQIMNTSFEPFRIVNTYGAFGSVTKTRTEVVFEGTLDPYTPESNWKEYEFKCKPGNVTRRPCLISPYHYRLDWLMWFAAFQNYNMNPWLVHLAGKMLDNDPVVDSLLAVNPFKGGEPPRYVRASHYRYDFTEIGSNDYKKGRWWKRRRVGEYFPVVDKEMLKPIYEQFGWEN